MRLIAEEKDGRPEGLTEDDGVDHHIVVSRGSKLAGIKNKHYITGKEAQPTQ